MGVFSPVKLLYLYVFVITSTKYVRVNIQSITNLITHICCNILLHKSFNALHVPPWLWLAKFSEIHVNFDLLEFDNGVSCISLESGPCSVRVDRAEKNPSGIAGIAILN